MCTICKLVQIVHMPSFIINLQQSGLGFWMPLSTICQLYCGSQLKWEKWNVIDQLLIVVYCTNLQIVHMPSFIINNLNIRITFP